MTTTQVDHTAWQVRNPRTGAIDFSFEPASATAVAEMAARLSAAQEDWCSAGIGARASALREFSAAVDERREALLEALVSDTGRYRIACVEADNIRYIVERTIAFAERAFAPQAPAEAFIPGLFAQTQWVPYPVVGVISPWNFPVLLAMVDALPALAAGCAVLFKPSEVTPRHAQVLLECFHSVPALAPVTAMALGPAETGAAVVDHVDAVAFTGSVRTGRIVGERAAANFIPAFLEMGGNDAVIVMPSADLDRAVAVILRAAIAATGQACQSVERVYVHESIHDEFVQRLETEAGRILLNTEDVRKGHIGPLIFARQVETIQAHVDDAVARGATLRTGGKAVEHGGTWYPPTLLTGVSHEMRVMQEETFGPVIPIMAFTSTAEAIALANDTDYGLSANVFTGDEAEGIDIAKQLDGGVVSVNEASLSTMVHEFEQEPFKLSGLGRSRMGPAGVERYCRKKLIIVDKGQAIRGVEDYREPDT
jgi:aldehyde dehydrogenase (NAD+)